MKKQILVLLLKYGVGLGLLAWVVWSNWHITTSDGQDVGLATVFDRPFRWPYFVAAFTIATAAVLLTFLRWYLLVRAQDLPFTVSDAMRLGMVGFFFNTFLPGAVGGDIIKAAFVAREQSRRTVAVATVLIDRGIGFCGLFCLVAILGGYFWATGALAGMAATSAAVAVLETIILVAAALVAVSLAGWFVLGLLSYERSEALAGRLERVPKIGGSLAEVCRAVWMFRSRGKIVGLTLLMAIVGHFGFIFVFLFCSWTLNDPEAIPSGQAHFMLVPVGMTFQAGFPTPGGVGGELGYGWLYQTMGCAAAAGVLASLGQRAINWILGLLGYLIYLRMKPKLMPTPDGTNHGQEAA